MASYSGLQHSKLTIPIDLDSFWSNSFTNNDGWAIGMVATHHRAGPLGCCILLPRDTNGFEWPYQAQTERSKAVACGARRPGVQGSLENGSNQGIHRILERTWLSWPSWSWYTMIYHDMPWYTVIHVVFGSWLLKLQMVSNNTSQIDSMRFCSSDPMKIMRILWGFSGMLSSFPADVN